MRWATVRTLATVRMDAKGKALRRGINEMKVGGGMGEDRVIIDQCNGLLVSLLLLGHPSLYSRGTLNLCSCTHCLMLVTMKTNKTHCLANECVQQFAK